MTTQDDDDDSTKPQEEWKSLMGQDLVMKTIHPAPAAQAKELELSVQDVVQVQFVGRLAATRHDANDPNAPIFHDTTTTDNGWWLQIGQRDVVPALEMAVRFMHVGETALVWSHSKYAYGLAGRTHTCGDNNNDKKMVYELPAESAVAYQITVLRKVERMDEPDTIVQLARARKQQANDLYLHEWAAGAGKARIQQAYQRIAKDMEALLIHNAQQQQDENDDTAASLVLSQSVVTEAQTLRIDALNNITAVLLRAGDYHAAKAAAVVVLELDPHNFKALVRAAKAALLDPSSEFVEVAKALEAAAAHADPDSEQDLRKLTEDFARRKQAYEKVSKQMYQKAFDSNDNKSGHGNDRERANDKKTWNKVADAKEKEESSPTSNNKQQSSSNAAAAVTTNSNKHLVKNAKVVKNAKAEPHAWRNWLLRYVLPFIFQFLVSLAVWYFLKLKQSKQEQGGGGYATESTSTSSTTTTLENPVSQGAGVNDEF